MTKYFHNFPSLSIKLGVSVFSFFFTSVTLGIRSSNCITSRIIVDRDVATALLFRTAENGNWELPQALSTTGWEYV